MRTERIGGHKVEIYESVEEMPIRKYHKFNKLLMLDAGVGSDMSDVDGHLSKVASYIGKNEKKALAEINNLRQGIYLILNEVNVRHKSFAALVHSVDGNVIHHLTDEKIDQLTEMLGNEKVGVVNRLIESIKKKIERELETYFPQRFDDNGWENVYQSVKDRLILRLKQIIDGADRSKNIQELDEFLDRQDSFKIFYGRKSYEIEYDKNFEEACNMITAKLGVEVTNETTIYDFYNKLEFKGDGR